MDKKKAGRPSKEKGVKVSVYLDAETFKRVSAIAEKQGVTVYKLTSTAIKKI
jgi:predicted DNA-binding ribbon-helix-helix protein